MQLHSIRCAEFRIVLNKTTLVRIVIIKNSRSVGFQNYRVSKKSANRLVKQLQVENTRSTMRDDVFNLQQQSLGTNKTNEAH